MRLLNSHLTISKLFYSNYNSYNYIVRKKKQPNPHIDNVICPVQHQYYKNVNIDKKAKKAINFYIRKSTHVFFTRFCSQTHKITIKNRKINLNVFIKYVGVVVNAVINKSIYRVMLLSPVLSFYKFIVKACNWHAQYLVKFSFCLVSLIFDIFSALESKKLCLSKLAYLVVLHTYRDRCTMYFNKKANAYKKAPKLNKKISMNINKVYTKVCVFLKSLDTSKFCKIINTLNNVSHTGVINKATCILLVNLLILISGVINKINFIHIVQNSVNTMNFDILLSISLNASVREFKESEDFYTNWLLDKDYFNCWETSLKPYVSLQPCIRKNVKQKRFSNMWYNKLMHIFSFSSHIFKDNPTLITESNLAETKNMWKNITLQGAVPAFNFHYKYKPDSIFSKEAGLFSIPFQICFFFIFMLKGIMDKMFKKQSLFLKNTFIKFVNPLNHSNIQVNDNFYSLFLMQSLKGSIANNFVVISRKYLHTLFFSEKSRFWYKNNPKCLDFFGVKHNVGNKRSLPIFNSMLRKSVLFTPIFNLVNKPYRPKVRLFNTKQKKFKKRTWHW